MVHVTLKFCLRAKAAYGKDEVLRKGKFCQCGELG